ncbi:MAG TPA: hypothetical protein VK283_10285 [Acidimicrobiales bacterium]|nr:hypothetical protein [Acidimicrobiales bacterium]
MPSSGRTTTSAGEARHDVDTAAPPPAAAMEAEVALLAGWAAIGLGAALVDGRYSVDAVLLVTAGVVLLVYCAARRLAPARDFSRVATIAAGVVVLGGAFDAAGVYGSGVALMVSRALTAVAAVVVSVWLIAGLPRRRLVAYGAIGAMVAAGVAMIMSSPRPSIDDWYMLQAAGRGLSHGRNIYTVRWTSGIGAEFSNGFAYLPGAAVLVWPFHVLFGDVRYGVLAAMTVTAVVLTRVRATSSVVLLGAFVVLYPKAMFGLEQSWIDPLVLMSVCVAAYAVLQGRYGWAVVAFALCLVCKQTAWLMLPLALFWKDFGWRRVALSAAAALAFTAPWVAAAPHAFYRGAVSYNLFLPARLDSLSLFTTALSHGWSPGLATLAVATVGAMALVLWRLPRDTYGFLLGSAVVMAVFDLANKQSFFNEWALTGGLALAALVFGQAVASQDEPRDASHEVSEDVSEEAVPGSPQEDAVRL